MLSRPILLLPLGALLIVALPALSFGQAPTPTPGTSGVSVSPHNLNLEGIAVNNEEVCLPCHTAHGAIAGQDALWNHEVNASAVYTLYNTAHTTKHGDKYVGLDEASKLCLSCHDGAIAIDNYGGKTNGTQFMTGDHAVGLNGDLTDDHPVGLSYPIQPDGSAGGDTGGYRDPDDPTFTADGIGTSKGVQLLSMPGGTKGVGCRSCHHSHNSSLGDFLRTDNQYSFLCRKCHTK
jgi:predicted CXXCH cytochrome family protein